MAKLPRLQWIPMIFEAFHEAKVRTAPTHRMVGGEAITLEEPVTSPPGKSPSHLNGEDTSRRQTLRIAVKPHISTKPVAKDSIPQPYQRVLRELRFTKRQLRRLLETNRDLHQQQQQLKQVVDQFIAGHAGTMQDVENNKSTNG